MTLILTFFLLLFPPVVSGASEKGEEKYPFNPQLRQLISRTFYKGLQISREKIAAYRRGIEKRYRQVESNLKNHCVINKELSPEKVEKKVAGEEDIKAYKILLEHIGRLNRTCDPIIFNTLALKILEMDYALKIEGKKLVTSMLFEKINASLTVRKIPVHATPEGEASNLVDPATGLFYNQEQLKRMKKQGVDISKLNPPSNSTFYTPHHISKIDVKKHYLTGQDPLHKGMEIVFPGNKGYYKKVRKTQTKPKIDIYIPYKGKKLNFKLKVGAEMHSEATGASLYTALGFSADISKYVRDFKLVLGDTTPQQFKRAWYSYYSRYDIDRYIKRQGKDKEGYYIIFYEGLLEAKPRGLLRLGPWAYGGNGHKGLREVRGTLLFDMWISNLDLKEAENNKLVLRKIKGKYRFFHIQHDMGFAFGRIYIERPGDFKWKLVRKKTRDYVIMSYRCFQENSGFGHVTFSDAKWMARLIAQLSRKQIQAAVELGGWPESMGKLLVEKLIARRNQLVQAFDLEGEVLPDGNVITRLPFNPYITTEDGVVVSGNLKVHQLPGYIQYFGPRLRELLLLLRRELKNLMVDSVVNGISAIQHIKIDPEWLGWSDDIISYIILRMNREIELNPKPTGENDEYLVKDTMEIGFRLGYGFILSGDVSYVKKFTVVYPVRTLEEGRYHNHFILNFSLPVQVKRFGIKKKFTAVIEDYIEGRGRIRFGGHEGDFNTLLGTSLTLSKIYLSRHFISRKKADRLVYFRDKSLSNQLTYGLFMEFPLLFYFRIPFVENSLERGTMTRHFVELNLSDIETNPGKSKALERLILDNDPSLIKKMGTQKIINDKFFRKKSTFSLFGMLRNRSIYRVDKFKKLLDVNGENGGRENAENCEYHYQVENRELNTWTLLDNGEKFFSSVRLTGESHSRGEINDPVLMISLRIDDRNTWDGELKRGYLHSINLAALDERFIDFDSSVFSKNNRWGYVRVYLDIILYKEAIEALFRVDGERIWKILAGLTGRPVKELKESAAPRYRRGRPVYRYGSVSGTNYLACKTDHFIRQLKKARKTKNALRKMRYLVKSVKKAVYTTGHSFDSTLLAVIHKIVGKENLFLKATVTMPVHKEMVFPERIPFCNEMGVKRPVEHLIFENVFDEPSEIYHLF